MKPSQVAIAVDAMLDIRQPMMLWGPPGVGKSDIVAQAAARRKEELRDVRLSLLDPVDLKGFPTPNAKTKQMTWLPPDFLPTKGKGVLFLDELPAAPQSVQAAAYQLVLNRKIGDYELPEGWSIIAAGNRAEDRAVFHRMPSPLANRFTHIEVEPDLDDFCTWALTNGLTSDTIAFLRFRANLLYTTDLSQNPRAFPTPRSWARADTIHSKSMNTEVKFELLRGTIGDGASTEFISFLKTIKDLPSIDKILLNPDKAPVPTQPATQYAISTTLAMKASGNNMDRLMTYMNRLPLEFQIVFVRTAIRSDDSCSETEAFSKWAIENGSVLT